MLDPKDSLAIDEPRPLVSSEPAEAADSELILISGEEPVWLVKLCSVLSGCALICFFAMAGGRLLAGQIPPLSAMVMLLTAVLLGVGSLILSLKFTQQRRAINVTPEGFEYHTPQSTRTFVDDDVMCISLINKDNFRWGQKRSTTRRFILWIETDDLPERIICVSQLSPLRPDPLEGFILRIVNSLHRAARGAYAKGERVEGDGWAFERGMLVLRTSNPKSPITVPVANLSAIEIVDDHINVWQHSHDLPVARIPVRTANAHLLYLLGRELLPHREAANESATAPGSLGRVIFERRLGTRTADIIGWLTVIVMLFLSMLFSLLAVVERRPRLRMAFTVIAATTGTMTISGTVLLEMKRRARFRRHAHGIYLRTMFTERRLLFTEIANMSYTAQRHYSHGIYSGTMLVLAFTPLLTLKLKPIRFATFVYNPDAELDRLRDDVSEQIAARMFDVWTETGSCTWTQYLKFKPDGLEYRALAFTGRKPPTLIPYTHIANFEITEGAFHLWVVGQRKSTISEETSQPNFFPGLLLLAEIIQRQPTNDLAAPTESTD